MPSPSIIAATLLAAAAASAQRCTRQGLEVSCDDGRHGILPTAPSSGRRHAVARDAASERDHRQQIIGRGRQSGFVGEGKGVVPLDDPNAPNKTRCAVLDGVPYCC